MYDVQTPTTPQVHKTLFVLVHQYFPIRLMHILNTVLNKINELCIFEIEKC